MAIFVIIAVIIGLRILAGIMTPDEPEPVTSAALPPPPRKPARRRGPPKIPSLLDRVSPAAATDDGEAVVHPMVSVAKPLPIVTVAPARLAPFLRGRDAQRRAFIAGEVFGHPLSLR